MRLQEWKYRHEAVGKRSGGIGENQHGVAGDGKCMSGNSVTVIQGVENAKVKNACMVVSKLNIGINIVTTRYLCRSRL